MSTVTLVDTSVLCEILRVPGKSDPTIAIQIVAELDRRWRAGERLVIPLTAVIETGNHIAQAKKDERYEVARRFVALLRASVTDQSPWLVLQGSWGADFLTSLCTGASTHESLETLAAEGVGAGDIAILVERDQLRLGTAVRRVQVWTLDAALASYAAVSP
jgi:hypothetical protein